VRYMGAFSPQVLREIRKRYAWSLVVWNPHVPNQYYAAPNKMFESLAAGVPVICAPHPQCKEIIERETEGGQCGWLLGDWQPQELADAIRYCIADPLGNLKDRVATCQRLVREEFNREVQFGKLAVALNGRD